MVEQLARGGVRDPRVLEAFAQVPRHRLLPEALAGQAYRDTAVPIGDGQTISAPSVVAAMSQALELVGHETVLEVGTGSAYQAAILARLAARVISIERVPRLAARARKCLDELGVDNAVVYLGDGSRGRPGDAPFDAIVVTAAPDHVPQPLVDQLAPRGRMVIPVGSRHGVQELLVITNDAEGRAVTRKTMSVRFVPLTR
jgi:protein-L-isoaspartate(D-aspartate) O-methyltransferase